MMADGRLIDGSWELTIYVTDLDVSRTLRVMGDLHIGGVMFKLVEDLASSEIVQDWSDHALWWPAKNTWLSRTRSTLDQYGVQADAVLNFTPMHKVMRLQLPDLQFIDMRVDYSVKVFATVVSICKELGIRHPEELSLMRVLDKEVIKKGKKPENIQHHSSGHLAPPNQSQVPPGSRSPGPTTPQATIFKSPNTPGGISTSFNANGTMTPGSAHSLSLDSTLNGIDPSALAISPVMPPKEVTDQLPRPKNFVEKARINAGWLDSSISLMEQGFRDNDVLLLRYKFLTFYDLNSKYDAIRINQIYSQARWSLLGEELECTEEEMMMFAALQLQIQLQSSMPQPDLDGSKEPDDIDAALNELQFSLEGTNISGRHGDIMSIPELGDYLRFLKPKKFTLKGFKPFWFTFKDTYLSQYNSREEVNEQPLMSTNLRGCEVSPDVNISAKKFGIKLMIPDPEGMTEVWLRCDTDQQYARWMAACRLASKGKTMADSSYDSEVSSILAFLSMQQPAPTPAISPNQADIHPEMFVAPRFLKKFKIKQITQRILEAHANASELSLHDAKMNFIRAWQALPEFGVSYYTVRFRGCKKEELLGIAFNRVIRMDINNGAAVKTWRFNTMKAWNVNWEVKEMMVQFEEGNIAFYCTCADCKAVHEHIGGYIFCSMRSKDSNQSLNEEMFHKLTGGWS